MIPKMLLIVGLGAAIGALMGYFGQCSTGSCPLTANPLRGALYGGVIGLLFSMSGVFMNGNTKGDTNMINIGSKEAFEQALTSEKPVLVDFYATWCAPCKMLGPVLEKVAAENSEKAVFIKVDVDKFPELAGPYNVQTIPTVVLIKDGKEVKRFGPASKDVYIKAIDELQ